MDVPGDYVIARIGWHFVGSSETPEEERARYSALARFIELNGLATRPLTDGDGHVSSDFVLRREDLTQEGFLLIKKALARWTNEIDRTKNPNNVKTLERTLAALRKENE
jgi:hypothetical protein